MTYTSYWLTPGTTQTVQIQLTEIFTDASGSCPITHCKMLQARHDTTTYPTLNHRDFYTETSTISTVAVTTTTLDITQSSEYTTPFFALECYNSVSWQFSPYFKVSVVNHPCSSTTISITSPVYAIKLWIDLYVDWDSVETP